MAGHSYRDYIDPDRPQYRSDFDILQATAERTVTPESLAEGRYRENVLRLQCRDLVRMGLLETRAHDTFSLSALGEQVRSGARTVPSSDGLLDIEMVPDSRVPAAERLTDFEILDPETIKEINLTVFGESTGDEYGWVDGDPELTERRIKNVKEFQLNRVMREFPTNEPLPQQCAHWIRAFAGLHFFPDANHRTGMNTLQILVEESEYPDSLPISDEIERFVLQSKLIRHLNSDIRFNTLWRRDAHYTLWHEYFRNLLYEVPDRHPITPEAEHLRAVLNYARERTDATNRSSNG